MELMLLNPRLSAGEAQRLGLVTRVFPQAEFEPGVMEIARGLGEGPTRAYGVAKALINQAAGVDRLDFHLDQELQHLVRSANSPEFKEGLAAFFAKRTPVFAPPDRERSEPALSRPDSERSESPHA
jgi:2-(1,2-epoxy-1,2-dihydrophenyl)acetyl-CoA isomerase